MAADPPPFETFEHTADVGVVAHGRTLEEMFANVGLAMFQIVVNLDTVVEKEAREVTAEGNDWESLLVRWLNELIYLLDAEGMLLCRFQVEELHPYRLRARAWGEKMDPQRHELRVGIKGVTRHLLQVGQENGWWRARVVFDI